MPHQIEQALQKNWIKRLEKRMLNPSNFPRDDVMNCLSWVEKYTPDKRKRPEISKKAIEWLKANKLWDIYLRDFSGFDKNAIGRKKGAKPGNKNAAKDDGATSFIHARCKPEDKAEWVKAAQSEELKLTEWIVKTLNKNS